jgi:putative ATP-dependent endonuclease of OLD family
MILDYIIKVKNHKCFDSTPQGFEKIYPINLIIGKNNSGKSTLLDLIEFVTKPSQNFIDVGRQGGVSEVIISDTITEALLNRALEGQSNIESFKHFIGAKFSYGLLTGNERQVLKFNGNLKQVHVDKIVTFSELPLKRKTVLRISAERDIKPEGNKDMSDGFAIKSDGSGATNLVRWVFNNRKNDPRLVRRDLLTRLNEIVKPDVSFVDIYTREDDSGNWEIHLEDSFNRLIALSNMGSGIRSIILVLLNLIIIPGKHKGDYIFCFEELENNLHASWQRRLFNYISKYAEENNAIFFITTHSSVVIDLFTSNSTAQIVHVQNAGESSVVRTVTTPSEGKNILKDLEVKASDILLSNGVIWVEGPSDAIYIELLLDLYKDKMGFEDNGKLNYTIQILATAIWKYAGYKDFDWSIINESLENKIISLASINHNHLIVLDKDDNYEDKKPNEWKNFAHGTGQNKARLIHESMKHSNQDEADLDDNYGNAKDGSLYFWVNENTFETYLGYFINNNGKEEFEKYFGINNAGFLEKLRSGENSSISKVELASNVANYAVNSGLTIDDFAPENSPLRIKLERLHNTIKSWN